MGVSAAQRFLLRRPALEERLDESFGKRLTLLVAGAGYGKTTLLASWTEDLRAAWHTVSAKDRQLTVLAANIADAVRPHVGEPEPELVAALAGGQNDLAHAEVLAAHLSEAFAGSLSHDLILVLDDAHEASSSNASLRLLESLCRQAPATFHLVLASRTDLGLRIDRLRGQGQVLELGSPELALTSEDVAELSYETLASDRELADRIHEVTGGWTAGVRLAIETLVHVADTERAAALDRLAAPGTVLYSYLANEVIAQEPAAVQDLLRAVAPLDWLTVGLCDALGIREAGQVLDGLQRRGLFVRRQGDLFVLHELVRDFIRARWPLREEEKQSVHARAAHWLEGQVRILEALHEYAAGSCHEEVARMLTEHGPTLLASSAAQVVIDLTEALPRELRHPEIGQLLGEALLMRGDIDGAVASFEEAARGSGDVSAGLAWRMGVAQHFRGDMSRALESYARAGTNRGDTPDDALLLGWAATAHALRDEIDEATLLAERSLDIANRCHDDRAVAAAHVAVALVAVREGRYHDSDHHLRIALVPAERCGDLLQLARIRTNIASTLTARGSFGEALAELDKAIGLAEIPGFTLFERTLTNRANTRLQLGLLDEASADFDAVTELSRKRGNWELAYGLIGLGHVHRERGNVSLARALYEQGLRLAERVGAIDGFTAGLIGLARTLVDEDPLEAHRLAEHGVDRSWWLIAPALNAAGWVALALGDRERAAEAALEAARAARERGDRYALAEALELGVFAGEEPSNGLGRLEEALAIWRELGSRVRVAECELALARMSSGTEARAAAAKAERRLRALGIRVSASAPAGLLRTIAEPLPVPVAVEVFGGLRVIRDGAPVPLSSWSSKKARELLRILLCRRGHATSRELLMETLWPGAERSKLANRLSVALSTLRSVLDPGKRFDPGYFVKADNESVRVDLENMLVDVEVFLHAAEKGLTVRARGDSVEAADWLAEAESAYVGDVFEDDPYDDWAIALREEARATYLSVAHALAQDASAVGDGHAASRYLLRIIGHDAYDERAHLGLVAALERIGRHSDARRSYRSYVARMEEIDATPASFPEVVSN
jgi:DNA-binding SARP family transcriptional activator/tetratricopeptide (TPR) repeat protein